MKKYLLIVFCLVCAFSSAQTNPQGPETGKRHVCRSFLLGKNKWDRKPADRKHPGTAYVRIAISADDIN